MEFLIAVGLCWVVPLVIAFSIGVMIGQGRLRSPIAPKEETLGTYKAQRR